MALWGGLPSYSGLVEGTVGKFARLFAAGHQALPIIDLTEDTAPDGSADFVLVWDVADAAYKKVLVQNVGRPFTLFKFGNQVGPTVTVAETSIGQFTVPAGVMGANGAIRATWKGFFDNASGGGRTVRLRCKFGGTTWYDDTSASLASAALQRPFIIELTIHNQNDTGLQSCIGRVSIGNVAAAGIGNGDLATGNALDTNIASQLAGITEDTTLTKAINVTAQLSNTDLSFQATSFTVELL